MVMWLKYGVLLSIVYCTVLLVYLIVKTFSLGTHRAKAQPSGSWKKGVWFAFSRGMMPWEKESTQKHVLTYGAGIIYHLGIFASLVYLFFDLLSLDTFSTVNTLLIFLLIPSLMSGIGLLIKRITLKYMRSISIPDDFLSNILVDVFLLATLLCAFKLPLKVFWYSAAIILFLYLPLGKIRHCVFFFYSRLLFGAFFGRRGVYPKNKAYQTSKGNP